MSSVLLENDVDDVDVESYVKNSADPEAAIKELGFEFVGVNTAHPEDPCKVWRKRLKSGVWAIVATHDNNPNIVNYFKRRIQGRGVFSGSTELERKIDVPFRDVRRTLMKWKHEDAKTVVHHLLDASPDAFDPRAEVDRLLPHKCPDCGSSNVSDVDDTGVADCFNCGTWFDPLKPKTTPVRNQDHGEIRMENLEDEISDLKAYVLKHGKPPRISITFNRTTPESVEQGDYSETGWLDKEGVDMTPDAFDESEGITATDKAAKFLYDNGAYIGSSSTFHPGMWYSGDWHTVSYATGEEEERNYHLNGFTPEQEQEVYNKLKALRQR